MILNSSLRVFYEQSWGPTFKHLQTTAMFLWPIDRLWYGLPIVLDTLLCISILWAIYLIVIVLYWLKHGHKSFRLQNFITDTSHNWKLEHKNFICRYLNTPQKFYAIPYYHRNALALLGAGYLLKRVLQEAYILANGIHAYFIAPRGLARQDLKKYGQWAGIYS